MDIEEILGRCEICGFISQESNVKKHIADIHQAQLSYELVEEISETLQDDNSYVSDTNVEYSEELHTLSGTENVSCNADKYADKEKLHWTNSNVKLLLSYYEEQKHKFENKSTPNKKIWKLISQQIRTRTGNEISPEQCENKFKNMKKTYKKIIDNNNSTGRGAIHWEYFDLMDSIFCKSPEVAPLSLCSSLEGSSQSNKENLEVSTRPIQSRKRKVAQQKEEEPMWFKKYREEAQERHREKMEKQDTLLSILNKLVEKD